MIEALAVLATFAAYAFLMFRRWMPAIIAVPAMAVTMMLVTGVPLGQIGAIFVGGSARLASVYVTVIAGALLARVTLDTGIARALVNLAAEYGGEQPFVVALLLCAVVAVLFTSLSGLGAIIMVGSIVLPIMMTTGVPRTIAATMFLMAFALGFIFNLTNWKFYTQLFGVVPEQLTHYALVLAVIDAVALVVYAIVAFRRERAYATWAVRAEKPPQRGGVPAVALLAPVLPLVLYFALHLDPLLAFVISAIYAVLVTKPRDAIRTFVAAAIRGVEDVAPAVLLFMGIGVLLAATAAPQLTAALQPLVAGHWIRNPVAFVVLFGLLSPLTLYRGPLNPFGVGIAIFTVLLASHALPPIVLVAAVMAVVQVQNVCDPTNTANVWVANFTGVSIDTITVRTLPYQMAVATIASLLVVSAAVPLFGSTPFASVLPAALADASGFYAPSAAKGRIAVDSDGSRFGSVAAAAVVDALRAASIDAFTIHQDPNITDCSGKRYAAYLFVSSSTFALIEGTDLDIGLRLEDCGGWIVGEWHDHATSSRISESDARSLAGQGVARLRGWLDADPRAKPLLQSGIASIPGDPPTFYYTLFKTVDGNMRAYVRAGGPAYIAGLRTNDIVDKLDGRFWWEYGTYQTQLRAYDGKPHQFEVERNGSTVEVQLGAPFVPPA